MDSNAVCILSAASIRRKIPMQMEKSWIVARGTDHHDKSEYNGGDSKSQVILKCQLKYVFGKIAGQLDKSEYNQENTTHFTDRAKCHVRPDQKDCSYKDQADRQKYYRNF